MGGSVGWISWVRSERSAMERRHRIAALRMPSVMTPTRCTPAPFAASITSMIAPYGNEPSAAT